MLNLYVYKDILFVSMRNVFFMYVFRICISNVYRNVRDYVVIYDWYGF